MAPPKKRCAELAAGSSSSSPVVCAACDRHARRRLVVMAYRRKQGIQRSATFVEDHRQTSSGGSASPAIASPRATRFADDNRRPDRSSRLAAQAFAASQVTLGDLTLPSFGERFPAAAASAAVSQCDVEPSSPVQVRSVLRSTIVGPPLNASARSTIVGPCHPALHIDDEPKRRGAQVRSRAIQERPHEAGVLGACGSESQGHARRKWHATRSGSGN